MDANSTMESDSFCFNHGNQLVESHVVAAAGVGLTSVKMSPINDLYAMSLFVRMGGHHIRLILAIDAFLDQWFFVVEAAAPTEPAAAINELKSLFYQTYVHNCNCVNTIYIFQYLPS